jgi:hypothetical protein
MINDNQPPDVTPQATIHAGARNRCCEHARAAIPNAIAAVAK